MTSKQFLYIAIATFITVVIWLGLTLISSQSESQIPNDINKITEPVNPTFDQEVINEIGN